MNRQQFALVVTLGLLGSLPPLAAGTAAKASDWKTTTMTTAAVPLSTGKLYRNSADQNGSSPYVLLDKWGVVRGYVAAGQRGRSRIEHGPASEPARYRPHAAGRRHALYDLHEGHRRQRRASAAAGVTMTASADRQADLPPVATPTASTAAPIARGQAVPCRKSCWSPQPAANDDNQYPSPSRSSPPPRSSASALRSGTMAAYQEPIPAPPPGSSAHMVRGTPDPAADPGPMDGIPAMSQGRESTKVRWMRRPDGRTGNRRLRRRLRFVRRRSLRQWRSVRCLLRPISTPPGRRTGRCSSSARPAAG